MSTKVGNLLRCKPKTFRGPHRYWKIRKILKMASHFTGRKQRCHTLALSYVIRALRAATDHRKLKRVLFDKIRTQRLEAACEEHGFTYKLFKESLIRSNILLHKTTLTDLAIWEPRTFKCLTDFAWNKAKQEGLNGINSLGDAPSGVILRPMIIKKI